MQNYKESWAQEEGWTYDEAEMEEDVFKRRVGKHPTIESILSLVSMVEEDTLTAMAENWDYDAAKESGLVGCLDSTYTEQSLEAIFLQNQTDLTLLRVLQCFEYFGNEPVNNAQERERVQKFDIAGDIASTWNKEERCGVGPFPPKS
jgi:hypothetical protein